MNLIITFILGYIILITGWSLFTIFFFIPSVIFKRNLVTVPLAVSVLVNFAIDIYFIVYPLYILWQIFVARDWLLLGLALIFGYFLWGFIEILNKALLAPFIYITTYFYDQAEIKKY